MAEFFEFFEGFGPVFLQKEGEGAVGEEFAGGLAVRTVVGFVVGVADALDFCAAIWTRFAKAAMDGHAFAEGCDVFGEGVAGFGAEFVDPFAKSFLSGAVKAGDFVAGEFLGEGHRGEAGAMEDFV